VPKRRKWGRGLGAIIARAVTTLALIGSAGGALAQGLEIAVEVNPDPVRPGQTLLVEYTVSNTNPLGLVGVVLESEVPAGVNGFSQSLTTGGGSCTGSGNFNTVCSPGETVTWDLGDLAAGERTTVAMPPVVSGTSAGSVLAFQGNAMNGGLVSASQTVAVVAAPVFELAIDATPDPVQPGEDLHYVLSFSNVSGSTTVGATLSLPLPPGTSFISAGDGGVFAAGNVTWNLGAIPPGGGGTREAVLAVDGGLADGTLLRSEATIANAQGDATATSVAAVLGSAGVGDLDLAIAVTPDPVRPGDTLHVELTATNTGVFPIVDVLLETRLPDGLNDVPQNLSTGGGRCSVSGNLNTSCSRGERIEWDLGTLGAGERVTVTLPAIVTGSIADGRLVSWRATAWAAGGLQSLARQTVIVHGDPVFDLLVDEERDPVGPGDRLAYTLSFSNRSPSTATGTVLRLPLPPGTRFVSASDGGLLTNGAVEWALGPVTPGQGDTRHALLETEVDLEDGNLLRTVARIFDDGSPAHTTRAANVAVIQEDPGLRLAVAVTPDPVRPGETLAVELTATNAGAFPVVDAVLETRVPDAVNGITQSLTTAGGSCTTSGNLNTSCTRGERIRWTLGSLSAGERISVSFPAVVTGSTDDGQLVAWRASLTAGGGEQVTASQTAIVHGSPVFDLLADERPDPALAGDALRYALSFANRSNSTATGTVLRLPVPDGALFESASDGGVLVDGAVVWNLGPVLPGRGGVRHAEFLTGAGLPDGELLRTVAAIHDDDFPRNVARAASVAALLSDRPFELDLEVNPDPVRPGETLHVEVTVANPGLFPLFDVVVETRVPDFIGSFDQSLSTAGGTCSVSGNLNAACSPGERLAWIVGSLGAGERKTLSLPAEVVSLPGGELVDWRATAVDGGGGQALARQSVIVESAPTLELAVDESPDPVAGDGDLTAQLTFANRGPGVSTGTTLALPVPVGTSFVSATEGGVLVGGRVEWSLGGLLQGQGGTRTATFRVLDPVDPMLLRSVATIRDDGIQPEEARATFVAVATTVPLALSVSAAPDPAQPADTLLVELTVQNQSPSTLFDVVLESRVPDAVNSFSQSLTTGAGSCAIAGNRNTACTTGERIQWQLGNLAPLQQVTVSMPPVVASATPDGTLLRFFAVVDGSQAVAHRTVRIGVEDADGDGRLDRDDNCIEVANGPLSGPNDQIDGDADGYGNVCDCDFNQDGSCNIDDFAAFLSDFVAGTPGALETDMSGDGFVNIEDFNLFLPGFNRAAPGPSAPAP